MDRYPRPSWLGWRDGRKARGETDTVRRAPPGLPLTHALAHALASGAHAREQTEGEGLARLATCVDMTTPGFVQRLHRCTVHARFGRPLDTVDDSASTGRGSLASASAHLPYAAALPQLVPLRTTHGACACLFADLQQCFTSVCLLSTSLPTESAGPCHLEIGWRFSCTLIPTTRRG